MNALIYTTLATTSMCITDESIAHDVMDTFRRKCQVEMIMNGMVRVLNNQQTRCALKELEAKYEKEYVQIKRLLGSIKKLSEGEAFYFVNQDMATLIERRTAMTCVNAAKKGMSYKAIHNSVFQALSFINFFFSFYSFGFDGIKCYTGHYNKKDRKCRFCGESCEEKFNDKAHAIQNSLGNRLLFCYDECDTCNHTLNVIEDHFLRMMNLRRAIFRIPNYKSSDAARIIGENYLIEPNEQGDAVIHVMKEAIPLGTDITKPFIMRLNHKEPITNENMYKALVKMVIDVLPDEEVDHFKNTAKWVMDENWIPDTLPDMWFGVNHVTFHEQPIIDLIINNRDKKMENAPYCTGLLWIYDIVYMFVVPMVDVDNGRYKNNKNLEKHWNFMMNNIPNVIWKPQKGFGYWPSIAWVDWEINPDSKNVKIMSKNDPIFEDCLKKKLPHEEVQFPPIKIDMITKVTILKMEFKLLCEEHVDNDSLTDVTQHFIQPTFWFYPSKKTICIQWNVMVNDTTDTIPYFSEIMEIEFELKDFWKNISWETDSEGLKNIAIDYHLRNLLLNLFLAVSEKNLAQMRKGTCFERCTLLKMLNNERLFDTSIFMIPDEKEVFFMKIEINYHQD